MCHHRQLNFKSSSFSIGNIRSGPGAKNNQLSPGQIGISGVSLNVSLSPSRLGLSCFLTISKLSAEERHLTKATMAASVCAFPETTDTMERSSP